MESKFLNAASPRNGVGKIGEFKRNSRRRKNRFRCRRQTPFNNLRMECVACEAQFNSLVPFLAHLNTRKHKTMQLMKDDDPWWMSSVSLIKRKMLDLVQEFETDQYGEHYCEYCDKKNTGVVPLMQHFRSRNHKKHVRQAIDRMDLDAYKSRVKILLMELEKWTNGVYQCKLCRMVFNDKSQIKLHKRSKMHFRNKAKIMCAKQILSYFNERYPLLN
nr:uncharacterized protein LOC107457556 [Parasteatoda tepidariorum]